MFLSIKTWKKNAVKSCSLSAQFFFQYCQIAQNQPKSQFMFDKNWSPRDLCIMILYLSHSSSSLLYWVNTDDTLPLVFWWVTGHSNPGLFNSKLRPQTSQPPLLNTGSRLKSLGLRSVRMYVCNRGDTIQYHCGLLSRELGQAPMLLVS